MVRIFDPIGHCSFHVISAKMLIKKCWKIKDLGWDDAAPPDIHEDFKAFLDELPGLQSVMIPRCYRPSVEHKIVEIATFGDASSKGYATTVYVISEDNEGNRVSTLAFAKAKVQGLQTLSRQSNLLI